ncbi:TetR/AcrR family transcriptional regulator [Pseudofrankia inefficax]|uniref:Regulatory protein TetR n=1 Tax=Pseudofrankia inefficax (strain DSM 45817 / CECT 9037 / DDB 130130 / EuI1c) TaxID=298654 RepID=E3IVC6_PSEI1|nr:TetR/AcrR family transcriptional regulator [Pseudofrankia inefficax]ADP81290.1 regulatory protein TetR [Pseudofrankia inefficax]
MTQQTGSRVRDPERREKILAAATELIAARGYHAVTMAEIGREAGIVGSGVYRHFTGKAEVLSALLDQTLATLLADAARIIDAGHDSATTIRMLVRSQVDFSIDNRDMVRLYRQEAPTLPAEDGRRLRRAQRHYNEEWAATVSELRPDLNDAETAALVQAAIAAIQSVVTYDSGLPRADLVPLLTTAALSCLGLGGLGDR